MTKHSVLSLLFAAALASLADPALAGTDIVIQTDQAKIISVPGEPGTVVVGNPSIADVTVQGQQLFVMGRSYGTTNLIVLDREGNQIAALDVTVMMADKHTVQVFKAAGRASYACAPVCEQTLQLGDRAEYFDAVGKSITSKSDIATGTAKAGE